MVFGLMSLIALLLCGWSALVLFGWLPKGHAYDFYWRVGMYFIVALFIIGCFQEVA